MLFRDLAALLPALALAGTVGAGTSTLPAVTVDEAEWVKLQGSHVIDDFEKILRDRVPDLLALTNATLAALQSRNFSVRNSGQNFYVVDDCELAIRAWRSNSTATLAGGSRALTLSPGKDDGVRGEAYEVGAVVEVPLNTTTAAFAIVRQGFHHFMNSKCSFYAEKPVQFDANYSAAFPAALRLQLSHPMAVIDRDGGRQVVLSLSASMHRNETRMPNASLKVDMHQDGHYGCHLKVFRFIPVGGLFRWLKKGFPWWYNFTSCDDYKEYFQSQSDRIVDGGVAPIADVAIRNMSGQILEAVGTSVVIPVQIARAAGASPSPSCASGSRCPIAI